MKFQKFVYLSSSKTQLLMVAESGEKGKESGIVEAAGPLLRYLAELMRALKYSSEKECPPSPSLCPVDGESLLQDVESDWMDDMGGDDEDSGGEESVSEKKIRVNSDRVLFLFFMSHEITTIYSQVLCRPLCLLWSSPDGFTRSRTFLTDLFTLPSFLTLGQSRLRISLRMFLRSLLSNKSHKGCPFLKIIICYSVNVFWRGFL